MNAEQRRAQVLSAALSIFGEQGYGATGTYEIAEKAGISQPYVVRLFGTKRDLFLAVVNRAWDRLEDSVRHCADVEVLPVLLQSFAASSDPVIRETVRNRFGRLFELARSAADPQATEFAHHFLAEGMLLTAMAALQLVGPHAHPTPWSRELLANWKGFTLCIPPSS